MAQRYFGLNRGADHNPNDVTVGTSTGSTDIELRIDDSKGMNSLDVNMAVDAIMRRILDGRDRLIQQV